MSETMNLHQAPETMTLHRALWAGPIMSAFVVIALVADGNLARYGVPRSLEDMQHQKHRAIHFARTLGAKPYGWEYPHGDSYATPNKARPAFKLLPPSG